MLYQIKKGFGMKKFYNWMLNMNYGAVDPRYGLILFLNPKSPNSDRIVEPTNEMLIGYMIKYIKSHNFFRLRNLETSKEGLNRTAELANRFKLSIHSEDIYKVLEKIITDLDK